MIDRTEAKREEDAARAAAGPLATKAILYCDMVADTAGRTGDADFDAEFGWAAVEAMVDIPSFIRYGAMREVINWSEYRKMLSGWGGSTDFWYNFRRVTECPASNRVFWELEEHNTPNGGEETVVNSMTAVQFNDAGMVCRMDVYIQSETAFASHENWG